MVVTSTALEGLFALTAVKKRRMSAYSKPLSSSRSAILENLYLDVGIMKECHTRWREAFGDFDSW